MKTKKYLSGIFAMLVAASAYSQDLSQDRIQHLADTMLISPAYKIKIKKILPQTNNLQAVLVELPYREFPSIILLSKNPATNTWTRVFEGLSPGIQEEPTGLYNWDKAGLGKDFSTKDTANNFSGERVRQLIDAVSVKKSVIIPYQNFLHFYSSGDPNSQEFAGYTVDKTSYRNFANRLFKNKSDVFAKKDCSVYNTPTITDATLEFKNNQYILIAKTDNKQLWTYTFDKVDNEAKFLVNKSIRVEGVK